MPIDPAIPLALALIRRFEGCRLEAYPDPGTRAAPWTIGYGATGPAIDAATVWTQAQADADLESRTSELAARVRALLHVPLPDRCIAALISFAYNVGLGNLRNSTLRAEINEGHAQLAAAQFLKWTHADGRELPGLVERRTAERGLFVAGLDATALVA